MIHFSNSVDFESNIFEFRTKFEFKSKFEFNINQENRWHTRFPDSLRFELVSSFVFKTNLIQIQIISRIILKVSQCTQGSCMSSVVTYASARPLYPLTSRTEMRSRLRLISILRLRSRSRFRLRYKMSGSKWPILAMKTLIGLMSVITVTLDTVWT